MASTVRDVMLRVGRRAELWPCVQDFQQLLRPGIVLVRKDSRAGTLDTHESFKAEFGFEAALFPDFQALAGACLPSGARLFLTKAEAVIMCSLCLARL